MPPSPALRCSPGREARGNNNNNSNIHKRGHSFEGGLLFKEKDEDLALFNEMQTRERESFLLESSDDLEATFSSRLRHFSDIKLGLSIPARGESSDLLNVDGEKNDYDWLLTPPDTPLFPSLDDDEPPQYNSTRRGRPRSQPISISRSSTMEKSYRSSRGSASPNRLSPSPRSGSSTLQSRGRPSSTTRQSSPSPSLRQATPPSKSPTPVPRSSTPTPRRLSTSTTAGGGGSVTTSGLRGVSPVKTSRGNSASPKISSWQANNIPGFSTEAPPNLRTSLADRPAVYVRGSSPAPRNGRRQSMSPTASRSVSSSRSHERDPFSCHSRGSVASSGDDDVDSIQSIHVGSLDRSRRVAAFSNNKALGLAKKSNKSASPSSAPKRSFDSAVRQVENRKSPQNMFRPLLSSVPSTTFYAGKSSSAQRPLMSRNSSVTTSSSSDQGTTSAALDAELDHNHDDEATQFDKVPLMEVPEEVFAFDKMDMVGEADGHEEILDESTDVGISDFDRASKTEFGLAEPREPGRTSETSIVNDDFSEVDSLENALVCARCGCRYRLSSQEEQDVRLCPDCKTKEKLFRVSTSETVVDGDMSIASSSTNVTDANEPIYLHENSLPISDEDRLATQKDEDPLPLSLDLPNNDTGVQNLLHISDDSNPKVEISEGTGISVLLKRTSSNNKGHVFQGRPFSASNIPYDVLSYSKDSASSMRSSIGHGSFSTSSSVDLGSRQSDTRVQRQLSGKRLDSEYYRGDRAPRPPSTGSSFSGISSLTNQAQSLSRSTQEDNFQVSVETVEHTGEADVIDETSFARTFVSEENDCECKDRSRTEELKESPSSSEPYEGLNESNSKTELEAHDTIREFSPEEKNASLNVDEVDCVEVTNHGSVVTTSEIEAENHHSQSNPGSLSDNVSLASKSTAEDYVETLPSDKDMIASTPDSKTHDHENDIQEQETTVVVESPKGRRTRSLTLEEATDTILYCRSIVHDLAYQAATIALEKEKSSDPFEGSQPTVTILGKSNHDIRDPPPHGRVISNRTSSKPQKTKKKWVETETKGLTCMDENDENALEPLQRNVRSPNKVDSLKPPKLESKCNCTIM